MHVPPFHEAEHFARQAAHLERFEIEPSGERIQGAHDIRDGLVTMRFGVRRRRSLRFGQYARIRFPHHLFAEIDPDQVVLVQVVIEHVLGGFPQVGDPFGHIRRADVEGHVSRITSAGGVIIAANSADPAGDEVSIARIFALHEDAVAAEDGGRAVAFRDLAVFEIDLGVNA